ncbi:UNVERIFIED_CONTAM: nuoG [Trichonephila clavipes]
MPEPYVALARDEAARLGVNDGALLALRVNGQALRLPLQVRDDLGVGLVGLPVGLPGIPATLAGHRHPAGGGGLRCAAELHRAAPARLVAGPLRPQPRRAVRHVPDRRRHDQDVLQGGLDAAVRRQVHLHPGTDDRLLGDADGLRHHPHHPDLGGGGPEHRHPVLLRHGRPFGLRGAVRRLVEQQQVRPARQPARVGPDHLLRGVPGPGTDGRGGAGRLVQHARHRRLPGAEPVVHHSAVLRLLYLLHRCRRRDPPSPVRPAGSRTGAGRRLPHRIRRDEVGHVLRWRVRRHRHRLGPAGDTVLRWLARPVRHPAADPLHLVRPEDLLLHHDLHPAARVDPTPAL